MQGCFFLCASVWEITSGLIDGVCCIMTWMASNSVLCSHFKELLARQICQGRYQFVTSFCLLWLRAGFLLCSHVARGGVARQVQHELCKQPLPRRQSKFWAAHWMALTTSGGGGAYMALCGKYSTTLPERCRGSDSHERNENRSTKSFAGNLPQLLRIWARVRAEGDLHSREMWVVHCFVPKIIYQNSMFSQYLFRKDLAHPFMQMACFLTFPLPSIQAFKHLQAQNCLAFIVL